MASSEALSPSRRFSFSVYGGSLPQGPRPRASLLSSACPSFRAVFRTPADQTELTVEALPSVVTFAYFREARHPHSSVQKSVHARGCFRGCKVRFMLRPGRLLALHRQGRLRSSFHPMSHLTGTSNITTRVNSQFPRPVFRRLDTQPCRLQRKLRPC